MHIPDVLSCCISPVVRELEVGHVLGIVQMPLKQVVYSGDQVAVSLLVPGILGTVRFQLCLVAPVGPCKKIVHYNPVENLVLKLHCALHTAPLLQNSKTFLTITLNFCTMLWGSESDVLCVLICCFGILYLLTL